MSNDIKNASCWNLLLNAYARRHRMVAVISKKRPQLVYVSKRNATHSSEKSMHKIRIGINLCGKVQFCLAQMTSENIRNWSQWTTLTERQVLLLQNQGNYLLQQTYKISEQRVTFPFNITWNLKTRHVKKLMEKYDSNYGVSRRKKTCRHTQS